MNDRIPVRGLILVVLTFILLAAWANPKIFSAHAAGNKEDPRKKLEEINKDKADLKQQINELKSSKDLAHDELEDIDKDLNRISDKLESTTSRLQRKRSQVASLNESHAKAVADLGAAQERFEVRLVEWYKTGAGNVLGSLVTKGNLSDFLFAMSYTEAIIQNDRDTISFIREQQGKIFEEKEKLDAEVSDCEKLVGDMRTQETEYQDLHERHYAKLTEIAGDVREAEQALRELEASSYEITQLLQAKRYTGGSGGALIRPITANVTSSFGMRRHPILGGVRMHTGVDMPAPGGTPIHAAGGGLVVYSGWKKGYGYCLIIDHGGNLATLYGHCSVLLVGVGETVSRGQVVAKVGTTGLSTGYHLHFEVRINGEPVNPIPYISGG